MNLTHFLHCKDMLAPQGRLRRRPSFYISMPTRCECGALVRLLGENKPGGCWVCPLCGCRYPYVFWKVRHEPGIHVPVEDDLILALGENACQICGESRPPCRCARERAAS